MSHLNSAGGDSLFGRVVELVLVGASEALLHARVHPEATHGRQQLVAERLRVLHPRDHVHHHLGVRLPGRGGRSGDVT